MLRTTMLADMCMCMQLLEMFQLMSKTKHLFYESRSSCRDYKRCITNSKISVLTLHRIMYTFNITFRLTTISSLYVYVLTIT